MDTFETSATVREQGRILVDGSPFAAGTQVDVVINPVEGRSSSPAAPIAGRAERLLDALDKARNTEPIGRLHREELYDRDVLR